MGKIVDAILIRGLPAEDIRRANIVNLWCLLWAVSLAGIIALQELQLLGMMVEELSFAAALLNVVIGAITAIKYRRMLRTLDEMERTIQYNAFASAVAAILLAFGASAILSNVGLASALSATQTLVIVCLTYMIALVVGRVRMA